MSSSCSFLRVSSIYPGKKLKIWYFFITKWDRNHAGTGTQRGEHKQKWKAYHSNSTELHHQNQFHCNTCSKYRCTLFCIQQYSHQENSIYLSGGWKYSDGTIQTGNMVYAISFVCTVLLHVYFYRTQVYLGSDLWVQVSETQSKTLCRHNLRLRLRLTAVTKDDLHCKQLKDFSPECVIMCILMLQACVQVYSHCLQLNTQLLSSMNKHVLFQITSRSWWVATHLAAMGLLSTSLLGLLLGRHCWTFLQDRHQRS